MVNNKLISTNAEKYGILFDLLRRSSNEEDILVEKIISQINHPKYASLFDIGAGDGSITQRLMPFFDEVDAIDKLDSNIVFLQSLGINTQKILWEDYQTDKRFDIVLASHIIYHFPVKNWIKEINRMQNLLKQDGQMFIVVNSVGGEYSNFLRTFYPKLRATPVTQMSSHSLVDQLKEQCINARFVPLQSQVVFENKTHFLALCRFLIDYDFNDNNPIKKELEAYYKKLSPLGCGQRRYLTIDEDFIIIKK